LRFLFVFELARVVLSDQNEGKLLDAFGEVENQWGGSELLDRFEVGIE
jgi:hypothetical protein